MRTENYPPEKMWEELIFSINFIAKCQTVNDDNGTHSITKTIEQTIEQKKEWALPHSIPRIHWLERKISFIHDSTRNISNLSKIKTSIESGKNFLSKFVSKKSVLNFGRDRNISGFEKISGGLGNASAYSYWGFSNFFLFRIYHFLSTTEQKNAGFHFSSLIEV